MGDCLVVSYIIPTFDLSMVKSETGQGNKFFSKRVDSDLPYTLVWGKYISRLESTRSPSSLTVTVLMYE